MGIVAEDVDRVRSGTDLVALVSERVALRRVGTRWVGLCPFHSENTGSFSVNAELGRYYCFGCLARGDAISWLRDTEHLDFPSAVELLAARAGVTLRYDATDHAGPARKKTAELGEAMEKVVAWYHERLLRSPDASHARRYLRGRGYDSDTVKQFRLGWAPEGWDTVVRQAGVPVELLVGAGVAFRNQAGRLNDSFRARVLFPIFDAAGHPVGLGGRVLPGAPGPKYKNTQATALYDKSRVLYGLNWAKASIVERGRVVVCEGYTDVIGLHRAGVTEAVATCGTALADGHVKLLAGFSRRIVLAYDADSAGQGAAERFYDWERRFEADIAVVGLPPGADPADLAQSDPGHLSKAVAEAVPYLGFRLQRLFEAADLRNPEGRAKTAEAALDLIAEHPDDLVRDQYLMQVADRCHLSPEQLRARPRPGRGRPDGTGRAGPAERQRGPSRPDSQQGPRRPGRPEDDRAPAVPAQPARPPVPLPEMEALRLAVHHPEQVAGRLDVALFGSDLARSAFAELASAVTLHGALEAADPQVADLLAQLAVIESAEEPDDVLRRLLDRAAATALNDLTRQARSSAVSAATGSELSALSARVSGLQLAVQAMKSVEQGPGYESRLAEAEGRLLALLLGSPSMVPVQGGKREASDSW
jgi:DNA primase